MNEDFSSWCLLWPHPKPSVLSWSSQAPCGPVCFSEKPFCVFQRSPNEQTTRWWTPLTSWSHVLLEAACLPKKELFSRRTLLTGRSLNVALQNSSHKVHGNVFVALMMSREEGEMLILCCGVVSGRAWGWVRFMWVQAPVCCLPAMWPSLIWTRSTLSLLCWFEDEVRGVCKEWV